VGGDLVRGEADLGDLLLDLRPDDPAEQADKRIPENPHHGPMQLQGYVPYLQPPLARDTVRYVGEPVAVVVATSQASAVDAHLAKKRVALILRQLGRLGFDPTQVRPDLA
jgi:hypothetical protein